MECGHIPSFCTACYREGRTGDRFMTLLKSGKIHDCCHPNALITLKEFAEDYASKGTRRLADEMIERELMNIPTEKIREIARRHIAEIENGKRDFRF